MARIPDLLASKRTLSFEFFPPKTPAANMTLGRTVAAIESLHPDFVSITYGAGGSDRHRTGDVVAWMIGETTWTPMPHLTCRGHRRDDVGSLLEHYAELGIENILALGGDPPAGGVEEPGDYLYAMDLLEDVVAAGTFAVGVAAHPQVHPRSPDRATDRRHLAAKLSIADFALHPVLLRRRALGAPRRGAVRRWASTSPCCRASCRSTTRRCSSGWQR